MFFDILKVGAVAAFSPLQSVLTVLILTKLVAGFGTEVLAGYGIGARLEFLLVPIVFAVGVASVPMVGMAVGAGNIARARQVAWTAAGVATVTVGFIGLAVAAMPDLWSGLFTADPAVRAAANLYLRWVGPVFGIFGLGSPSTLRRRARAISWARCSPPRVRLVVIALGGWWLAAIAAPAWAIFALVSVSMVAYGAATAAAVYFTPWGNSALNRIGWRRSPREQCGRSLRPSEAQLAARGCWRPISTGVPPGSPREPGGSPGYRGPGTGHRPAPAAAGRRLDGRRRSRA